ncbi:hypothetical protein CR513_39796, partial [Mucuna pruriens]
MYISGGNDQLSCKLFPDTLRGVTMQWMAILPARSFAVNKVKKLEVADLFDIKQGRGKNLKSYLARFNNATVRVDDLDQKFFVKAFQKGLRVGPFNDALALRRPSSMEEIRAQVEKHIEVEEDQTERLEAEHNDHKEVGQPRLQKGDKHQAQARAWDPWQNFAPLTEKRTLLDFPPEVKGRVMGLNKDGWCDFHRAFNHSAEDFWSLKTQIERLVQQGHEVAQVKKEERERRDSRRATARPGEVRRERSRSRMIIPTWHRGTIATISGGGGVFLEEGASRRMHEVQTILTSANRTPLGVKKKTNPALTFEHRDLKHGMPSHDEPMVISVIAAEYRIERVLMDQGTSANILYWSTFKKMNLPPSRLIECSGTLGFAGERVLIKGTIELETIFGERSRVRVILVLYTVVDAVSSYNIIMGRPALNRLGTVISTYHLCMKFLIGQRVENVWADSHVAWRCYEDNLRVGSHPPKTKSTVNILDLDLDLRCQYEHMGPHPAEDLKEIQLGPLAAHKTRIGTTLSLEEEACLVSFLRENNDIFAWTTEDMPSIDPDFMWHCLLVAQGAKWGEEKQRAAKEETNKLLAASFIREMQYPTWLANVVMVKKASGKWRMYIDYTDLNKACPKDPYPLPSIDRLVDGVSGFALLSFMDANSGYNQI